MKKQKTCNHDKLPVIFDIQSRRMFLKGMGAFLALPLLPSLLKHAHASQIFDGCVILTNVTHGATHWAFRPGQQNLVNVVNHVRAQSLNDFSDLGPIIGNRFDGLRNKVSLLQGLDQNAPSDHYWYPWSASRYISGASAYTKFHPEFGYSMDAVMAESSKIYPNTPAIDVLRIDPKEAQHTYSFLGKGADGKVIRAGALGANVLSTWNAIKGQINPGGSNAAANKIAAKKSYLADRFLAEVQKVSTSTAIGKDDKILMDNFIEHLHEVQKKATAAPAPGTNTCNIPNFQEATDNVSLNRRLLDIMTLAMACGVTKLGTFHFNWASSMHATNNLGDRVQPNVHARIHQFHTAYYPDMINYWTHAMDHYSYLVKKMDALNLLDKSAVVFTSDFATSTRGHHGIDLPVIVSGGLNGKLRTGEVINFQNTNVKFEDAVTYVDNVARKVPLYGGRRWNELLITLMTAAGLAPSDYEREGRKGFGSYDCDINGCGGAEGKLNGKLSTYQSSANYAGAVNTPLPYYYKG